MTKLRIILADDHNVVREGVKSLIQQEPDWKIVGEAKTGIELLALLKSIECDLIILDIAMPEMDGFTALREIKCVSPKLKVLIFSMLKDFQHFRLSKALGAEGYLSKDDLGDELICAIQQIMKGKAYVSPSVTQLLADNQIHTIEDDSASIEILTKREIQVLRFIARGMMNKHIASELKISIHTIENHRANLMKKLGLKTTAALVKFALGKGLI